jgi:alpha-beta hydrolase superfamily lysophospholipase
MTEPVSETIQLKDGTDMVVHVWKPAATSTAGQSIKGIVIIYHGFLAHGLYPTVRYAAELLARTNQYIVLAPDQRGHGTKPVGLQHYLPSREVVIEDSIAVVQHAQNTFPQCSKIFLMGSSMGGTIALNVAQKLRKDATLLKDGCAISGVVLLAPMLQLSVGGPARTLLWMLSFIAPTWEIIPSSSTNSEKQYRDPIKRAECDNASMQSSNKIRIASASTCVELASTIQEEFHDITTPYLLLVADEDYVVNNQGDFNLFDQSPSSTDKTMKRYPALHGLLCEPSPLVDTIENDILEWIRARS